jgi:hypothetical protein
MHISCNELLDLATYHQYFSEDVALAVGHSKQYVLRSSFDDVDIYTAVTFRLMYIDAEAFMDVRWRNYFEGRLVESHADQIAVEKGRNTDIALTANSYSYLFRNSCTLQLN